MTANDPVEDPDSVAHRHALPADDEIEGEVDMEKSADVVELPEGHQQTLSDPKKARDRTEAEPATDEVAFQSASPIPAENIHTDEADTGRLPEEENVTNAEEEGVENLGDIQNSEVAALSEGHNLESDDKRTGQIMADPNEQKETNAMPASSKEAIQDPGVVDNTPTAADNNVIDVDTFDDDVSDEDEPVSPPVVHEMVAEPDNANEPSADKAEATVVNDSQSEPIDLTVSPPTQAKDSPTLPGRNENMSSEETNVTQKQSALSGESVIDVDEEEQQDDNEAVEAENRKFVTEDVGSSPLEEDEDHGKGTTDTETVSAELNVDVNGDDVSSEGAPAESSALETVTEGEMESHLSVDRTEVAERNKAEEESAREGRLESDDDRLEPLEREATAKREGGIDFMEVSPGKPDSEQTKRPVTQDESEVDEMDEDVANGQSEQEHEENEAGEDGSPTAPSEIIDGETEAHENTASAEQTEVPREESQDKDLRQDEADKHVIAGSQGEGGTSRTYEENEDSPRSNNDDISALDPTSEDDVPAISSDGEPQPVEIKERVEQDTSAPGDATLSEKTMVDVMTGDVDMSQSPTARVTPDPLSLARKESEETQSAPPCSDLPTDDSMGDSREDVIIASAERENDAITGSHSVTQPVEEVDPHTSKQQDQERSGVGKETKRGANAVSVEDKGSSSVSEPAKKPSPPNEISPAEESKTTGTGHLAPMFGIQLSRPVKSGPVTFSSPPSFPRYSLNPHATPFLPAKHKKNESTEQPADPSETPSTALDETKATDRKALKAKAEKDDVKTMDVDQVADTGMETSQTMNSSTAAPKPQVTVDKAPPAVTLAESVKLASQGECTQSAPGFKIPSVAAKSSLKSSVKVPAQKKVSFALTPIEIKKSEKEHTAQARPVSSTQEGQRMSGVVKPISHDAKAKDEKQPKPEKPLEEADGIKEKQRILQVQTDEGLRREVKNVTVAMRQGSGKVRPERKKFTIRLTTGIEEKAKLQFFKVTGSSLKLYASLDSSRDTLRVRKVTNRQYVISVAKVTPPGDDAAEVIVKYFLHFEEQDTFEEMYSQCVAHLQKQPKSNVRPKKTDHSSTISKKAVEEKNEDKDRQSLKSAGVKRSAETLNAAQVSKKSKLLADKKKLLDKMAALRRKKEQKGTPVAKERRTESVAATSPSSARGHDVSDKGVIPSDPLKSKDVETKPKSVELKSGISQGSAPTQAKVIQPPRKRIAEDMTNENASKRARLPGLHSANQAIGLTRTLPSEGNSQPKKTGPASMRKVVGDELKLQTPETKNTPATSRANHANVPKELSQKHSEEVAGVKRIPNSDISKEQKAKEAEALMKVTKDLKQSEDEKNELQKELDSRSRLLDAEREKSLRVQQESSEAWQRIIKTVEALSADMGRLRRDDSDRSLESLRRCEVSSSEDFFDRLHSFRPSTWAAFENSDIGALECALRGWHNCGPGKIRSSEGAEITLSESFDDANLRDSEVERVHSLLREGHCLLSGWIGQSCPESFRTLEGSQKMLTKEQLRGNVEELREESLERTNTRFEWAASALLLSDDVCEKLAVYNWGMDGECLRCSWCNRRVVVQDETRFDAKLKHYAFCPFRADDWKTSVLRNATTLGIEGDGDAVMRD